MGSDDWIKAAATDDALVADLLLRLKHSCSQTPAATSMRTETKTTGLILLRWGRKKARSRPDVTRFAMSKEFKERATRSPTTPLSWSGGCGTSVSGSGNVDGFEASSMMCGRSSGSRSKITAAYELVNGEKATRKKTYNELKKEERLLLDERLNLKRDLATLHDTLTHQRVTNQNLKRIKSMNVLSRRATSSILQHPVVCVPIQTFTSTNPAPIFKAQSSNNEISQTFFSSNNSPEAKDKKSFTLPDLNMLPSID